jgi:peptide/nickel transport system permease protein
MHYSAAMFDFLLRRLVALGFTLLVASLVIFLVLEILPGDPAQVMLGIQADEQSLAALRHNLGLDKPAPVRYLSWIGGLFVGDFGTSHSYGVPVGNLIAERLPVTIPLALYAVAIAIIVAIPLGLFAASHHNRPGDFGVMAFSQFGIAIPDFWFGLMLVLYFAVSLGWFRAGGFPGWEAGVLEGLKDLTLPALALGLAQGGILARVTRSAVLDTLREDYVRTARAKGVRGRAILWGHVFRNALIPIMTIIGLQVAFLLSGTIIIENVFFLPGLGQLVKSSIDNRDLIVIKNVVMMLTFLVVAVNFLVDIAYAAIDPRPKHGH